MRREDWARLVAPFPPHALQWRVAEVAREGDRARLEPVLAASALRARLDAVAGRDGWSFRLLPWGDSLVGELSIWGVSRSAVAAGPAAVPPDPNGLADWALARAAAGFGLASGADDSVAYWVEFDPDAGEPLYLPEARPRSASTAGNVEAPPAVEPGAEPEGEPDAAEGAPASAADVPPDVPPDVAAEVAAGADSGPQPAVPDGTSSPVVGPVDGGLGTLATSSRGEPEGADPARSEGQRVIERLMERLKSEGLGREAARVVVEHGGYGATPEQARELYRSLRALLVERGAAVP